MTSFRFLSLDILHLNLAQRFLANSLLRQGVSVELDAGDKFCRLPRAVHGLVQLIDLLERQALGLVDEEVDEEGAEEAAGAPDEEDFGAERGIAGAAVDHEGGGVGDGPVEEPVAGDGERDGFGAEAEGEDLALEMLC